MTAELEPARPERRTWLTAAEDSLSVIALMLMMLLPVSEMATRILHVRGVPASPALVQQLTLWVGLLGAALASRSGRLLALSSSTFLPERIRPWVSIFTGFILAAVSACLAWASWVFVESERLASLAAVFLRPNNAPRQRQCRCTRIKCNASAGRSCTFRVRAVSPPMKKHGVRSA